MDMKQVENGYISDKGIAQEYKQKTLVPPRFSLPSAKPVDKLEAIPSKLPPSGDAGSGTRFSPFPRSVEEYSNSHPVPAIPISPSNKQDIRGQENTQTAREVVHAQTPPTTLSAQAKVPVPKQSPRTSSSRHKKRWRRVPEMRQMSAVECGACCLAMVLNYYGCTISVSEIQERCGVGRDGLSALTIVKVARQYGLRVRTVSLKKNDFRFVTFPAIAHWDFNHFVVVERWSSRHVDIIDPAVGRRRLSPREFEDSFTGVLIMLEPGTQFERQASMRTLSLWTYLRSLPHMQGVVAQIIGISFLLQILGIAAPLMTQAIVDDVIPTKASNLMMVLGMSMLFLILMQAVMKLLRTSLLIYLQARIDAQMMLHFLEHLLSLPYRFFQMRMNGDLMARAESNSAIRDLLTSQIISTLLDGSSVIVYLVVLIMQSRLFAGITVAIGVVQVGLLLTTAPAIRRLTMRYLGAQGKTQGYLNEVLAGVATVKAAGAEPQALTRWTNLFFDEMNISVHRNYLLAVVGITFELLQFLSPLLLLWIGAMQVITGTLSIGAMLALNTLAISFLIPLSSLASSGQKLQVARAHFDRLADVLESEPEQDLQQVHIPPKLQGHVELRNVSFQYDPHTPPILNNISLSIHPGQKVALVGKTGSGKSTLGKLLIGLITPTKGDILFDGIPLQKLNYQEVRRQFGIVLQESFIFSGSVRENITFNNPELDMEQITKAAQAAAIHEDIQKMPMRYETLLSEGGSVFSGGQRQRLALARALANNPALILLDEATSALDVTTEKAVEQNLNNLPCTQIVIAHRLSTIRNADLILVLDQGHIVEQGTHHWLLQHGGFYARLIKIQMENGEIEAA